MATQRAAGTGSVYKRAGSAIWQMSYWDGTYVTRKETSETVRHMVQMSTHETNKRRAEDKLRDKLAAVASGTDCGPKGERTTVADLYEGLLRDYRINGKHALRNVETYWNLHIKPFIGRMRANEVTRETVSKYVDHRLSEGASNATVNRELACLKKMFRLALGDGVLRMPQFPHLTENNTRTGFIEEDQYVKLGAACSQVGLWLRALLETGYSLGWRVGELLKLRVSQVDLLGRGIRLETGTTKNKKGRTVAIEERLYPWIQACVVGKDGDRFVFSRDRDGLRPIKDFRIVWYKVCCAAGQGRMLCRKCGTTVTADGKCPHCGRKLTLKQQRYEGLIFHDLRRSGVRNLIRAGVPEHTAMSISGHKTRSTFDRYDIVSDADRQEAARKMNAYRQRRGKSVTDSLTDSAPKTVQSPETVNTTLPS